jgi:hypothetical protein
MNQWSKLSLQGKCPETYKDFLDNNEPASKIEKDTSSRSPSKNKNEENMKRLHWMMEKNGGLLD